jgi:hypothetical protein
VVKAIARAHRWRRMLESGEYASVSELAAAEKINQSYICRILRLTLLAPKILELIVNGRQPASLQLDRLRRPLPLEWERQCRQERGTKFSDRFPQTRLMLYMPQMLRVDAVAPGC